MDRNENLGAAERIIQTLLAFSDHVVHNRPGVVVPDARTKVGVRWDPVTHEEKDGVKTVYKLLKQGKKNVRVPVGTMQDDGQIVNGTTVVGRYQPAGLFPEVAEWFYRQIAEVWKLDNEFAARWASYAFGQEHRDLKVALTAFMLVQSRKGDPVVENGEVLFHDDDFRDVGEAMVLINRKDKRDLSPKLLLRVHDFLSLPEIAAINRELGFGRSARKPFYGRWPRVVTKWLNYREENPRMLDGLVNAAFRTTVMELARRVGYKPLTPKFFEVLRWKQKQASDGRRTIAIGQEVAAAETWEGLTEEQICEKIEAEKPNWKRVVGLLPKDVGVTRAIMTVAIESNSLSNKDIILLTPTLEELGLLEVQDVRARWTTALKAAEDMRAANIARNVRSKDVKEQLDEAADVAIKKAVEEVVKGLEVYVFVDISGSMENAIETAKGYIAKFLQGFPADQLHVAVFNTTGRQVNIRHSSKAGVTQAFRGIRAGGGTDYGSGVRELQHIKPKEGFDTLFIFVGDEEARVFTDAVRQSGLNPMAFGFVKVAPFGGAAAYRYQRGFRAEAVRKTAGELGIPCFMIDEDTFGDDPYAIPRTISALIAATPVNTDLKTTAPRRVTLVDTILKTKLLIKPAWAA